MSRRLAGGLVLTVFFCLQGCATPMYPLKNPDYFQSGSQKTEEQNVVILPFTIKLQTSYNIQNTAERRKEKIKLARGYTYNVLRNSLSRIGYQVTDYIALDEYEDVIIADDRKLLLASQIYEEYNNALGSIFKNYQEEDEEDFDYTLGIRVPALAAMFDPEPDAFVIVKVRGFVMNLAVLEDTALNTVSAVLSLGMTKLMPTIDDVTQIHIALVDADTGDIIWVNQDVIRSKSVLVEDHIKNVVLKVLSAHEDFQLSGGRP